MLRKSSKMPTEKELLALCLQWIEDSPTDAFDRAMLVEAIKAKLQPRQWVSLTEDEIWRAIGRIGTAESNVNPYQAIKDARAVEAKLKEKNS
jgi:hypothetical protein